MKWIIWLALLLPACKLPAANTPAPDPGKEYRVGDAVQAEWEVSHSNYAAHIQTVTPTGYIVRFDSDGIVQAVDKQLRAAPPDAPKPAAPPKPDGPDSAAGKAYTIGSDGPYRKGDAVVAIWHASSGSTKWYQGYVYDVRGDEIVVAFSDGTFDGVTTAQTRHRVGGDAPYAPNYTIGPNGPYRRGDAVVAVWSKSRFGNWYPAHVVDANKKGVTVEYDLDGVVETLPKDKIKHRIGGSDRYAPRAAEPVAEEPTAPPMPVGYMPGQKVSVFYETTRGWYNARVLRIEPDGTVVIRFDTDQVVFNITNADHIKHN